MKWASERTEAFQSDTHGRDNITLGELALDADGKFLALRTKNWANMGAYLNTFAPFIPTGAGTKVLASVYGFEAIHAQVHRRDDQHRAGRCLSRRRAARERTTWSSA